MNFSGKLNVAARAALPLFRHTWPFVTLAAGRVARKGVWK